MNDQDRVPTPPAPPARPGPTPSRRIRRRWIALALTGATLGALWAERRVILTRVIDDRLAAADLPVRYKLTEIGPRHQRLTGIVVGDPRNPDLTADWVETRTAIGLRGAHIDAVSAGKVRLRARWVDGRLSLGTLDRLLGGAGGGGGALPALRLAVGDARADLATPAGPVTLLLSGQGRLDRDFAAAVAVVAPRLAMSGCTGLRLRGALRLRVAGTDLRDATTLRLDGPVGLAEANCGGVRLATPGARIAARIVTGRPAGSALEARITTGVVTAPDLAAGRVTGTVALAQVAADRFGGRVALAADRVRGAGLAAARTVIDGGLAVRGNTLRYDGRVAVAHADLGPALPMLPSLPGTPVTPLLARLDAAAGAAARDLSGEAQVNLALGGDVAVTVRSARLRSRSGAYATLRPDAAASAALTWRTGTSPTVAARLEAGGGDLPRMTARITRAAGPVAVRAQVAPYRAGDAALALAPVTLGWDPGTGAMRLRTRATLSGPIGSGRIEGLTLPVALRRTADGALLLGERCVPVGLGGLSVAGLALAPAALTLCPQGAALVRWRNGRLSGAGVAGDARLRGRLGGTPLDVAMRRATLRLDDRGFALAGVEARLGAPGRVTILSAEQLAGTIVGSGVAGQVAGLGGQIANVPLRLSAGTGDWRFSGGALTLTGAAQVADAGDTPRFRPMAARGIALTLADNRIAARAALHEPTTGTAVADLRLAHTLSSGTGEATLGVPALTFGPGFQPDLLTPLTFGVVADVRGRIDGDARIAWGPGGVTSRGDFGTAALDLAAAFGPVAGIAGRLRFDDLLGLHTPPGQVATIRSVNPGIAVENGTLRYQLLGGTRVQVEGAEWPFAGGALTLDPTLLDFDAQRARRLTFRVAGARADQFLQQFDFDNLNATGVFDGTLPMVFDQSGGRIENGSLAMRAGGGTIAYVGALGQKQLGFWGDLAFQALRSLRYRSLALTLNGPLAGEMVTDVRFAGISQGQGAKSNFLIRRLQRLPFVFNVRIRAPFRGLIDSAASFYDPRRLIQRNLPALIEAQNRQAAPKPGPTPDIQPPVSEDVR